MASVEGSVPVVEAASPARAQSWPVVALLFGITSLVESICVSHVFAFLPLYLRALGTPAGEIGRWTGVLSAGVFLFGLPLVPFWGAWADKYSRKLILVRSALVEAVVAVLVAASQNRWQLAASLFVIGFQLGNTGVMLASLRAVTPERRVGLAISLLGIAGPIGMALGPAGGGWLVDHTAIGFRGLFVGDALLSLGTAALMTLCYREVRTYAPPVGSVSQLAWRSLVSVVTTPVSLALFAAFSLALLGRSTIAPFLALFVERLHPAPEGLTAAVGFVAGSSSLIGVLLSPTAGFLGDRIGFRRVLAAVTVGAALCLAAVPLANSIPTLALTVALFGGCVSAFIAMVYALLATLVPEDRRAATLNLAFVPFYVGSIIGPVVGAAVLGLGLTWIPLAGAALIAMALVAQGVLPRAAAPVANEAKTA